VNEVIFLGTAGGRYVVAYQLRSSAGTVIKVEDELIVLDPGPGTLVHLAKKKLQVRKISSIIVSHKHLDHSADLNVIIDALTEGGFKKRGSLFITEEAINECIPLPYLRDFLKNIDFLKPRTEYTLEKGISFKTTRLLNHGAENYGLLFNMPSGKILGFITDTAYFEGIEEEFKTANILVINVVRYTRLKGVLHLCIEDVKKILSKLRPELVILTHFGMSMLRANPFKLAKELSKEFGLEIKACYDGMTIRV